MNATDQSLRGSGRSLKTYCFTYNGTREQFLEALNKFPNYDRKSFYFNDYIVEVTDTTIRFGVQRSGHSGGYWFKPTIEETADKLLFSGTIEYIGNRSNTGRFNNYISKVCEGCMTVILLPLLVGAKLYTVIASCIKKKKKQPPGDEATPRDRLFYLMENLLHCTHQ